MPEQRVVNYLHYNQNTSPERNCSYNVQIVMELVEKACQKYLIFTIAVILACGYSEVQGSGCHLPAEWKGDWFQQGFPTPLSITNSSIGNKGNCEDRRGDMFLFNDPSVDGSCYRCLVIIPRHENVLQYKESEYCEEEASLDRLCSSIHGDVNLYTLFRVNAQGIVCPFQNAPFEFAYDKGGGKCMNPVSHVDTCSENSSLLLRYEACHDLRSTESYEEELYCLATWRDSSQNYLVARTRKSRRGLPLYEDTFRCFVYEKVENSTTGHVVGYKVSQSGDDQASCDGLSLAEAAQTMTFFKGEKAESECEFPSWLASQRWNSLDTLRQIKVQGNSTLLDSFSDFVTDEQRGVNGLERSAVQVRINCQTVLKAGNDSVIVVAKQVTGCNQSQICMQLHKRKDTVVQIQRTEVQQDSDASAVCDENVFANVPFETYVREPLSWPEPCPVLGRFRLNDVAGNRRPDGAYVAESGCDSAQLVRVKSACRNESCSTEFQCLGSWTEGLQHFTIVSPIVNDSLPWTTFYCLSYTINGDQVQVAASNSSCRSPNTKNNDTLAFSGSLESPCTEKAGSGASSIYLMNISTLLSSIFQLYSLSLLVF